MSKLYISGALTGIENIAEVKAFYEAIGSLCEKIGFQAYVPHLNTDPINNPDVSPRQVFEVDKHQVSKSDLVIAIASKVKAYCKSREEGEMLKWLVLTVMTCAKK